jgi:hypothetical protein
VSGTGHPAQAPDGATAAPAARTGAAEAPAAAAAVVLVDAGVCGHEATIAAEKTAGYTVRLTIASDCPHVRKIAPEPLEVDAVRQIGLRRGLPSLLENAYACCAHAACPVPSAAVKAVEVAAGLALPRDVTMKISKGPLASGASPEPRKEG